MRRFLRVTAAFAVLAASAITPTVTRASIVTPYATAGSQPVIDGVTHEWGTAVSDYQPPPATESDPLPPVQTNSQRVNVLRVDTHTQDLFFETALPYDQVRGRQRTTLQAARESYRGHRVVAAVNGDYFRTSAKTPVGLNIRNGELVSVSSGQRGAIGFLSDGTPVIGQPIADISITMPDGTTVIPLGAVNQDRDPDEVVLYTPTFGPSTQTATLGVDVILSGVALPLPVAGSLTGTVQSVTSDIMNTAIPADSVVLSTTGAWATSLASLNPGDTVQLSLSIDDPWQNVVTAVGGMRILVHEGIPATDFSTPPEIVPNARMAAGITAQGNVVLATVRGNQTARNGVTQADLGQLMASLGAVEAINLDGGGSATMAVDPEGPAPLGLVNDPSDGYERAVNTSLLLVSSLPGPEPIAPSVTAPVMRFAAGGTAGKSDTLVSISWQADDADGAVASSELQKLDAGVWKPVDLPQLTTTTITRRLKFNRDHQYRVRVTDNDGNKSDWVVGRAYRIGAVNERSSAIVRTGKWPVLSRSSAIGGKFGRNDARKKQGRTVSLSFSAVQIAWVGPRSGSSGTARVELDGSSPTDVSLTRKKSLARAVLFVGPALDETALEVAPSRTIKLTNISARARPYVGLDAFLLLNVQ